MSKTTDDQLYQYIDGELGPDEAAEIEAAMDADPGLRVRFEARLAENDLIKEAAGYLDTGTTNLQTKRLENQLAEALSKRRRVPSRVIVFPQWPMQLVAACALVAFGWWGNAQWENTAVEVAGMPSYVQQARGAHDILTADDGYAFEYAAANVGDALGWLSARFDSQFPQPDLSAAGVELVGARVMTAGDQPALHYLYKGQDGEKFSLIVKPHNPQEPTRTYAKADYAKTKVGYWQAADFDYAIVTETGFREPEVFAGLIQP